MVIHCVNGIFSLPGDSKGWQHRGVVWIDRNTEHKAVACEYLAGLTAGRFHRKERARRLWKDVCAFGNEHQSIIAHSNGCLVVTDMLRDYHCPHIDTLHLVCAACEADFHKNGLNLRMADGKVDRVIVYCGEKDWELRLAGSWMGHTLGWGDLGYRGPINVLPLLADRVKRVTGHPWNTYGHCDCWSQKNFDATMQEIVGV